MTALVGAHFVQLRCPNCGRWLHFQRPDGAAVMPEAEVRCGLCGHEGTVGAWWDLHHALGGLFDDDDHHRRRS